MRELEKKVLISKDDYQYLIDNFKQENLISGNSMIKQTNYYYDTDDLDMNKKGVTCRIRQTNGNYTATIKEHINGSELSNETDMSVNGTLKKNVFTDMGLDLQGKLYTERHIIFEDDRCKAMLDKNEYLGKIDYELEIEYLEGSESDAERVLQILRDMLFKRKLIDAYKEVYTKTPDPQSKSRRFFERKMQINKEKEAEQSTRDYTDPDDYMSDYYHTIMSKKSNIFTSNPSNELPIDINENDYHRKERIFDRYPLEK